MKGLREKVNEGVRNFGNKLINGAGDFLTQDVSIDRKNIYTVTLLGAVGAATALTGCMTPGPNTSRKPVERNIAGKTYLFIPDAKGKVAKTPEGTEEAILNGYRIIPLVGTTETSGPRGTTYENDKESFMTEVYTDNAGKLDLSSNDNQRGVRFEVYEKTIEKGDMTEEAYQDKIESKINHVKKRLKKTTIVGGRKVNRVLAGDNFMAHKIDTESLGGMLREVYLDGAQAVVQKVHGKNSTKVTVFANSEQAYVIMGGEILEPVVEEKSEEYLQAQ